MQKSIIQYLKIRIQTDQDPKRFGKPLSKNMKGLWRYRVENYRIICNIEHERCVVIVIKVAHRKKVYNF